MAFLLKYFNGPRLYRIHQIASTAGRSYEPNPLENIGDSVIKWLRFCWSVSYWTSPVLIIILYRRGGLALDALPSWTSYSTGVGVVLTLCVILRAIGRATSTDYTNFIEILSRAQTNFTPENKRMLSQYDFEFWAWPQEFEYKLPAHGSKAITLPSSNRRQRGMADKIKAVPCEILSYLAIHTFGRRMVFPGTTSLIQTLMGPMLMQGRAKLIEEKHGIRSKLLAEDGNEIDTMFVDRRNNDLYPNGNVLVVTCEGNSGFYEVGCMVTPLDAGYSVLGWNHPGFWGSTGVPFPDQERAAVEVVMQYAAKLGFRPYDTIIFAWSIGGYTATWAAVNYPDIRHIVLDATFDDIVPLAMARMPQSWKPLVHLTIKKYMHLNNGELLCQFPGPILLIRRTKDEMITTVDPTVISSNRGNDLVIMLLRHRYPHIIDDSTMPALKEWLATDRAGQTVLYSRHEVDNDWCTSVLRSYTEQHSNVFPLLIGKEVEKEQRIQLALFLVHHYLTDYDATHCQPLPAAYFRTPWSL